MQHLTFDDILAYAAGTLPQGKIPRIEAHLIACGECAGKVDDHIVIRERFDDLWDSWTAKRHAQAALRSYFLDALSQAEVDPGLRDRAIAWAKRIPEKTEAVLGVLMDASHKAARLFHEGLEELARPGALLRFSWVSLPTLTLGDREKTSIAMEAHGPPRVKITIDSSVRRVTVQSELVDAPWPLVIIVPKRKGKAVITEFEHPEGTDYLLAEFKDVADGEYILFLESQRKDEK